MTADTRLELLWSPRPASTRGPKPSLSVAVIAARGAEIADVEGLDAVSMQRVAEDLGLTKMSLYRYLTGKDDLVAVMIEHAVGPGPDMTRVRRWRPGIERWAAELGAMWQAHPWVPAATTGARVVGPNETSWAESGVAALVQTGLRPDECMDVVVTLSGILRNTTTSPGAGSQPWQEPDLYPAIRDAADRFPVLAGALPRRPRTPAQTRNFGVRCFLDGLEARLGPRR